MPFRPTKDIALLHNLVEQVDADLVVLSAHGHSGETRWPYGNVVVSFIGYGATPLLIVQLTTRHLLLSG
ncbi:MAG: universal stress protein [Chloroflexota bacterium]|nr:universal stress protein [Chloroflexota bacterium]